MQLWESKRDRGREGRGGERAWRQDRSNKIDMRERQGTERETEREGEREGGRKRERRILCDGAQSAIASGFTGDYVRAVPHGVGLHVHVHTSLAERDFGSVVPVRMMVRPMQQLIVIKNRNALLHSASNMCHVTVFTCVCGCNHQYVRRAALIIIIESTAARV